jgi:hypothetical protein
MPEFTVKEVRLPELHMPEVKRDDIVRSLSGVHLPEVELPRARDVRIKVPMITLTGSDVGKLLAAVAAIVRFVRPVTRRGMPVSVSVARRGRLPSVRIVQPRRRPRRRLAIGALIVGTLAGWALLRRPEVRARLDRAAEQARERIDAMRAGTDKVEPFAESSNSGLEPSTVSPIETPDPVSLTSTPSDATPMSPATEEPSSIS